MVIIFTGAKYNIGIDTNIEVIVVSLTSLEAHHSPGTSPSGCGELPRSLLRRQWPKLRYQFLFYHDETKLMMNLQIKAQICPKTVPGYGMVTCAHLGVMWPDCFSLVTCVATTVMSQQGSLHLILTVHLIKIGNKIAIIILGKQIKSNQNVLIRWYFENTNDLQWMNCLILNTPVLYLIFVIIILIRICFQKLFQSWV